MAIKEASNVYAMFDVDYKSSTSMMPWLFDQKEEGIMFFPPGVTDPGWLVTKTENGTDTLKYKTKMDTPLPSTEHEALVIEMGIGLSILFNKNKKVLSICEKVTGEYDRVHTMYYGMADTIQVAKELGLELAEHKYLVGKSIGTGLAKGLIGKEHTQVLFIGSVDVRRSSPQLQHSLPLLVLDEFSIIYLAGVTKDPYFEVHYWSEVIAHSKEMFDLCEDISYSPGGRMNTLIRCIEAVNKGL